MPTDELEDYAKEQINAGAYSDDVHTCTLFRCEKCERTVPFVIEISYSAACDKARPALDFAGTVSGTCGDCGMIQTLFSIKRGDYPEVEQEYPVCSCGSYTYITCLCERYEGASGLQGFFDEGVIVGKCATCGTHRTFLFID